MDNSLQYEEGKGVMKNNPKKSKSRGPKTVLVTTLYKKLHGKEPGGLTHQGCHGRLKWDFCPAWQLERGPVLHLKSCAAPGTFEKAQASARRYFASIGIKRVAVIPPYWDVINRGKGYGCERLFLSPEGYAARREAKEKAAAKREAKRRAERKAQREAQREANR